ncbi:HDOD domain-containing protein [Betaproteobacteria bacterium SCN2]|jgi:c-di-GMP-related signal transduction protein|nr:HDOD domain-containing protein [Betaproteobacteria bacterium SCN2]
MASSGSKGGGVDTLALSSGVVTHVGGENAPSPVREEDLRNRFLSFEPMFDGKGRVVARELVLRGQDTASKQPEELKRMHEDMLLTGLYSLSQDGLLSDQLLFVKISRDVMFSEALAQLAHPGIVWILNDADAKVAEQAERLAASAGMKFCLEAPEPDVSTSAWHYQRIPSNASPASLRAGRIIVQNISREFELARWPDSSWFMGEYFTGPRAAPNAKPDHDLRMELAAVAMRDALPSLIQFMRLNPSLESQLMRIAHSMAGGLSTEADSAAHAMIKMGSKRSQRVAILTALAGSPVTADNRLYAQVALARALLMGKLAGSVSGITEPDEAFEAGLFSTFPAAFSISVNQLYRRVGLSRNVYESLAGQDTAINKLLRLAHACEHQDGELMSRLSGELGISLDSVAASHVEAAVTAEDTGSRLI